MKMREVASFAPFSRAVLDRVIGWGDIPAFCNELHEFAERVQ
jgi:hypothetical protein